MSQTSSNRPERLPEFEIPPIPNMSGKPADEASTGFSRYRTELSHHRTVLSEHRTGLSEYRTDLSDRRTELSMRRTGMSFQRSRMSADRTLMSVIRTSLSLIGFGFTIYQAFSKLREAEVIRHAAAPRNFGVILIALGILILAGGLIQHLRYTLDLRHTRAAMAGGGLIHGKSPFPISVTFVVALALLLLGVAAIASIVFGLPGLA
ncbi:YidH family protein [Phenylobacterium sp. J367]|uniref:YidH family protein n=1 Tax=Phenylobacterium sp. J367 TaxID=2898435 RepID=UPI002151CFFE|nr:DUF202 domain-containing protein [Phenylobacterium sp. J367]MCR5877187.1 DUF202 domain-containing protein [Phenylobacterium sp. J367]